MAGAQPRRSRGDAAAGDLPRRGGRRRGTAAHPAGAPAGRRAVEQRRHRAPLHGRLRVSERAFLRPQRYLDRIARRQCPAPHFKSRLQLRGRALFARRPMDPRHARFCARPGHREKTESRRARGSHRDAGGRRSGEESHRRLGLPPLGRPVEPRRQVCLFHGRHRRHHASLPRRAGRGSRRAGHQGRAAHRRAFLRPRDDEDGVHGRALRGAVGDFHRQHRRLGRAAAHAHPRSLLLRSRAQQGRAVELQERRRHAGRRVAPLSVRLPSRRRAVPAHRQQSRRAAQRRGLRLRFQEPVLRRQRILRPPGEFPQLHRLRREVPLGHVGRLGHQRTGRT